MNQSPVSTTAIRIFLAEDHEGDVFLVKRALGRMARGYSLTVARDGEEALTLLSTLESSGVSDRPEVIVLDLNLPRINGIELLVRIRKSPCLRSTPIVIFTSSNSHRDREKAFELGATRYVQKPTDLGTFMAIGCMIEELVSDKPRGSQESDT